MRDRYLGRDDSSKTIGDLYRGHNKKCRALIGIDYTEATVDKFDTSLSHLQEYMRRRYGRDDLLLSELNWPFVTNVDFYLKTVRRCQNNSAIKHLKSLKKVVRIALANDWLRKDPFVGIQFKREEKNIEFLTQEELEAMNYCLLNRSFNVR